MKYKTTKKAVMNGYNRVLCVGYCDLQHLLTYQNPIAYTCGTYGWNCDIYEINQDFAICTGYRPFGNIQSNYEYNRVREKHAQMIMHSWDIPYDKKKEMLNTTLQELIDYYTDTGEE